MVFAVYDKPGKKERCNPTLPELVRAARHRAAGGPPGGPRGVQELHAIEPLAT